MNTERTMTRDEIEALVGDDLAYWLTNPFVDIESIEVKVRWWVSRAAAAAWDRGFQAACDETSVFHTPDGPTDAQNPYREERS